MRTNKDVTPHLWPSVAPPLSCLHDWLQKFFYKLPLLTPPSILCKLPLNRSQISLICGFGHNQHGQGKIAKESKTLCLSSYSWYESLSVWLCFLQGQEDKHLFNTWTFWVCFAQLLTFKSRFYETFEIFSPLSCILLWFSSAVHLNAQSCTNI